jgi:D-methionine transport system permease protein
VSSSIPLPFVPWGRPKNRTQPHRSRDQVQSSQVALNEIDQGLVEAARAMGCRRWHIVRHVLLPEAMPAIIGGATVTVIAMIGSSAMAGAVGAGGLGDLAIRYGYERYETAVMFHVIVILVTLLTLVQFAGERLARRFDHRR